MLDELDDFNDGHCKPTPTQPLNPKSSEERADTVNTVLVRPQIAWRKSLTGSVPSEVHVELLEAGLIPDPFVGFNEHKVQCRLALNSCPSLSYCVF